MNTSEAIQIMPSWWSWEAVGAVATFSAVLVALFQERFWNWWNKPNPKISVFHRRDIARSWENYPSPGTTTVNGSIITLAVQNSGRPIENAKVFWVASEYRERQGKTLKRERVFPERLFEWTAKKENNLANKSILLYGEEPFDFFISIQEPSQLWRPSLIFKESINEGPFKEFVNDPPNTSRDPNFEITIYLQIKGSNYVGEYWPIWMRHETGTLGGWTMTPQEPITAKEFLNRFPNNTEHFFKTTSERLIPKEPHAKK